MKKIRNIFIIFILASFFAVISSSAFCCEHKDVYKIIVQEADCVNIGQENTICCRCNDVVHMHLIPAIGIIMASLF